MMHVKGAFGVLKPEQRFMDVIPFALGFIAGAATVLVALFRSGMTAWTVPPIYHPSLKILGSGSLTVWIVGTCNGTGMM
jgi:hypothetical protein